MKPIQQWTSADILELVKKVDKKTWVTISVVAGLGILILAFVVWPAWVTRFKIRAELSVVENQMRTVSTLEKRKPEWDRNKSVYQKFIQDAKARLYTSGEVSLLLGQISKLAKDSKVSIVASKPKDFVGEFPKPFNEQYQGNLYDFTVEGGYHDLGGFMGRIENNPKLLQIQIFELKPNDQSPKSQLVSISLSAVSFKKDKP